MGWLIFHVVNADVVGDHKSKISLKINRQSCKAPVTLISRPCLRPSCCWKCWNRGHIAERLRDWSQRSLAIRTRVKSVTTVDDHVQNFVPTILNRKRAQTDRSYMVAPPVVLTDMSYMVVKPVVLTDMSYMVVPLVVLTDMYYMVVPPVVHDRGSISRAIII